MEAQSEQQCPLARLVQELAFGLEQVQELSRPQVQVQPQVQLELELLVQTQARLELLVQTQAQLELEPLVQTQVQLELEHLLQGNCPKPQLHRHRYKEPDCSQMSQLELRRTPAHPKALD